jgi:hypothetical protein
MTAQKQSKRAKKASCETKGPSSAERPTARSMNYWLDLISPADVAKSWRRLRESVKGVLHRTTSVPWGSGITNRAVFLVDVTASVQGNTFVLRFTERDTSKSGAPR